MTIKSAFRPLRAVLVGAALVLPVAAFAQQPAPASAAAPQISAAHLAAAREVVESSGISRSFTPLVGQFMDQIAGTATRTRPELINDMKAVMTQLKPEFDKQTNEIVDITARIFAGRLSETELKDTAAFFKSASGKKYVETQPIVLDDVVGAMQGWSEKLSTDMMTRVRAEMKKKGHEM